MPDEVKGSFGRVFVIPDAARRKWAARFPDALSTVEHAVRFGRVVRESEFGIAVYYAPERAMFVCNKTPTGCVVATVFPDLGYRPLLLSLGPRPNKNQRKREKAMKGWGA